ncbi:MAG: dihydropteroate synthase, partial [Deltaproteobacteria bacterium]|nr:dihydropteroate synthase [Deltaproteobacteria bacterium]
MNIDRSTVYEIICGPYILTLGPRTSIMGVLNVTPDSFSDGGRFFDMEDAVAHGEALAAAGADIIDVGGESSRPFSEPVPAAEEIQRVVPVIEELAGRLDAAMANLVADRDVPVVLMHMQGTPKAMQANPQYEDVVGEVKAFLADAINRAEEAGIVRSKIIVDPGIGFGKTVAHNLLLIKDLSAFQPLGVPVLIGPSRKSFISKLLGPGDERREVGTQAAVTAAAMNG